MFNLDINLRNEFEILMKDFGFKVLYIRASKYIKCKCYNELHKTGDNKCPICYGSGFVSSLEELDTVIQGTHSINYLSDQEIGDVNTSTVVSFLRFISSPKPKDLLLITEFDENNIPSNIKTVYEIDSVKELRGDKGRVELYRCDLLIKPQLIDIINKNFSNIPYGKKVNLTKGGKYIWGKI